jgi:L-fuculose-phosphate aldolase
MSYDTIQTPAGWPDERQAREHMCDIGRRIWQRGLCAGNEGNHSVRIAPDRILCTPTGLSKGILRPEDLCTLDMAGRQVAGARAATSEFRLHLAIYRAREDVNAVIHGHPPHATVFALANLDLPLGVYPEAEVILGPVRCSPYVLPGDDRLPESIRPYLDDTTALLLGNHGVVTWDMDLEQAYYKFEMLEAYARIILLAGHPVKLRRLSEAEVAECLQLKKRMGLKDPRL